MCFLNFCFQTCRPSPFASKVCCPLLGTEVLSCSQHKSCHGPVNICRQNEASLVQGGTKGDGQEGPCIPGGHGKSNGAMWDDHEGKQADQ